MASLVVWAAIQRYMGDVKPADGSKPRVGARVRHGVAGDIVYDGSCSATVSLCLNTLSIMFQSTTPIMSKIYRTLETYARKERSSSGHHKEVRVTLYDVTLTMYIALLV